MSYKIQLDALGNLGADGFAAMVASHIAALEEYDAHMVKVRADAANPDLADEDRHVAFPPPQAPAEVESAIRRTGHEDGTTEFVADYEIVGPSLAQKKAALFEHVSGAERDAIAEILPAGKVRHYQLRHADILQIKEEERSSSDSHFLAEQQARSDAYNKVIRWAAALHSDIEDLTDETVDAWEMKPFHG